MKKYFEFNQKNLGRQLREHRTKQKLSQNDVADMVGKSLDAYQRWEKGNRLTDIYSILNAFQALEFSTSEIIDALCLPPLTLNEVKAVYQDNATLKSIKENGIYSAMRENCPDIDDFTLSKLIALLMKEHLKRLESKHSNP